MMNNSGWRPSMGAQASGDGVEFRVWAPAAQDVAVELYDKGGGVTRHLPLSPAGEGVFAGFLPGLPSGSLYKYRLDGGASYPDPYSRSQPLGVHGPSAVVDPSAFPWHDQGWPGLGSQGLVIYECHVGTYTPGGTFDDLIGELPELRRLGITALHIMPVAEFPGARNWGYDGVDLFAPTRNYGGPEALRRFVDAAHRQGLGVILDVVYNHLGPDGNYLRAFSPSYFTDRYHTPWGDALNYDGDDSRRVRDLVIDNACYWVHEYHVDGLRLDATHAIFDRSPVHILRELSERVRGSLPPGRQVVLLAEDHNNDVRFLHPPERDGYGLDAVYADDFHHELRVLLTGEREGYYVDYPGQAENVAMIIQEGFLYQGEHSVYLDRPRGTRTTDEPASQFLFFLQNHDQVGNRAFGDRLHHTVDAGRYAVASTLWLLAPETPMIFMGQEFAASSPFLYFTDHEPELGRLVTQGRREEFRRFAAFSDPAIRETIPDPQSPDTFRRSKLDLAERGRQRGIYTLYRDLLAWRRRDLVFRRQDRHQLRAVAFSPFLIGIRYWHEDDHRLVLANFGEPVTVEMHLEDLLRDLPAEARHLLWSTADPRYRTAPSPAPIGVALPNTFHLPATCTVIIGPAAAVLALG